MNVTALFALCFIAGSGPVTAPLPLPEGEAGIGFDDLLYSPELQKVLVPAGRTGRLDLVTPGSHAVDPIPGFTAEGRFAGGHGEGTTSADSGHGLIFASDRSRKQVDIVDPAAKRIVATAALGQGPDYVRWVGPLSEVWVTEPRGKVIEYFKLETKGTPKLVRQGTIAVADGPESLVVDEAHGVAYANTWHDATVVIDLQTHRERARWPNGCEGARGLALDGKRGLLFVGCEEGKAAVLDVGHGGKRLGTAASGKGVDIIAYSARLRHLYVPGGDSATLTVLGVSEKGELKPLGTVPTAHDAHCVAADEAGDVYVCDPDKGRLLVFKDTFPAAE